MILVLLMFGAFSFLFQFQSGSIDGIYYKLSSSALILARESALADGTRGAVEEARISLVEETLPQDDPAQIMRIPPQ